MIVILKIILALFGIAGAFVSKNLISDFRMTKKSERFEELTIADKIKFDFIFYFSTICIFCFIALIVYFIISPLNMS
jgi:hypothetical protein